MANILARDEEEARPVRTEWLLHFSALPESLRGQLNAPLRHAKSLAEKEESLRLAKQERDRLDNDINATEDAVVDIGLKCRRLQLEVNSLKQTERLPFNRKSGTRIHLATAGNPIKLLGMVGQPILSFHTGGGPLKKPFRDVVRTTRLTVPVASLAPNSHPVNNLLTTVVRDRPSSRSSVPANPNANVNPVGQVLLCANSNPKSFQIFVKTPRRTITLDVTSSAPT